MKKNELNYTPLKSIMTIVSPLMAVERSLKLTAKFNRALHRLQEEGFNIFTTEDLIESEQAEYRYKSCSAPVLIDSNLVNNLFFTGYLKLDTDNDKADIVSFFIENEGLLVENQKPGTLLVCLPLTSIISDN